MSLLSKHEELILLAVWRLQGNAHGATVRNLLSELTGHDWSIAGVYAPIKRLAAAGLVSTYVGAPTEEREGRSKRHYKLTATGVAALNEGRRVYDSLWLGLPTLSLEA